MKKHLVTLILVLLCPFTHAYIFYDDFEGDELKPHWDFHTEYGQWDYEVKDGMLKVNGMQGSSYFMYAYINATDYDMSAKVGWDYAQAHSLYVWLDYAPPPYFSLVSVMGYTKFLSNEYSNVVASYDGGKFKAEKEAPNFGFHEFRMTRFGNQLKAFFNDELLLEATSQQGTIHVLSFGFYGSNTEHFAPLYVDEISIVVPEPAAILTLAGLSVIFLKSRRK